MTAVEERKTRIVSHVRGEHHLSCPCGWRNHIYTSKAQATDYAHAHDRTHDRTTATTEAHKRETRCTPTSPTTSRPPTT